MCHAACSSFAGLMVARFFLGVGEAAIAPGFTLITGMFYKREEQPVRYVPPQSCWGVLLNWVVNRRGSSVIASLFF